MAVFVMSFRRHYYDVCKFYIAYSMSVVFSSRSPAAVGTQFRAACSAASKLGHIEVFVKIFFQRFTSTLISGGSNVKGRVVRERVF